MGLADDLLKLQHLHDAGTLTEAEFAQAKARLLAPPRAPDLLGHAAQRWVDYKIASGVAGFALFAAFALLVWLPGWFEMRRHDAQFDREFERAAREQRRAERAFPGSPNW